MRRAWAGPRDKHMEAALSHQASPGNEGRVPPSAAQPEGARGSPRKQHSWRDSLTDRPVSGSPAPSRTHLTPGPAQLLPGHTELLQAPRPPPPRCMLGFGFCAAADPALSQWLRGRADPVPPATAEAGIALRVCVL